MSGITTVAGMLATKYMLNAQQQPIKVLLQYTTVRYRRKPRWLGTAKSKLFRVPERKQQLEEEVAELKRLHNNYHTQMKAVRSFLINEVEAFKLVSRAGMVIQTQEEEAAEWEEIQRINDDWNKQIAAIRDERLANEREHRNNYILERLAAKEQRDLDRLKLIEDRVRYEQEQAVNFITKENIDKAIEKALVQPISYNFAIDSNGNIHRSEKIEGVKDEITSS
ncbi:probable 28S ribosomal protein S26, mitochondrial [Toxorhynchites rutilus septentrionalis]|uniref:probable 28S ribosomal protein S26, mitochondrial n=1 Tax=Toxorhynchites rutilus septentrionalis TaxID=329112 RepID=UPI00247861E4|nr:probable 28S ribosomal protein S26, mitochondrial [Toxorhynchites rutilus septentrionalis]